MPKLGVVAKWLNHKGVGFITPDAGGEDYLVHYSEIKMETEGFCSLRTGEKVEYEVQADPRNPEKLVAVHVTGPGGSPVQGKGRGKNKEKKGGKKGSGKGTEGGGKGKEDEEKRIDPEDGAVCTWEEMFKKYKKTYVKDYGRDALVTYWESCKVKKGTKGGGKGKEDEEKRIDPEDGAVCTWEEMFKKYKKTYVKDYGRDALVTYWESCKLKKGIKGGGKDKEDEEKRIDSEDGAVCTWEEMFKKYKKTYVKDYGRDALVTYWESCKLKKGTTGSGKGQKKVWTSKRD